MGRGGCLYSVVYHDSKPDILMTRGKGGCLYLVVYHDSKPDILMTREKGGVCIWWYIMIVSQIF